MYIENRPHKTRQDYEEIARLERSRAFHAGVAWIMGLFTGAKATDDCAVPEGC